MGHPRLLAWLRHPAGGRGVYFADRGDAWEFWSYARLAEHTRRVAGGLLEAGVRAGEVVTLVQRAGPDFVAGLFGAMLAGAVPSPVAPPQLFGDAGTYAAHLRRVLEVGRPALVLAEEDLVEQVRDLAGAPAGRVRAVAALGQPSHLPEPPVAGGAAPSDRPALLQFTSGSTGAVRGVRVPERALEANVAAIRRWLRWTERDPVASWLPVHHDMGLVGCLVTPVVSGSDLWLMRTQQFVRDPLRYLRCFGERGARLTAMPNFGLEHLLRRVRPGDLAGLDLSRWRALIVGAERLDAAAFEAAGDLLAPAGFDRRALLPAYGLAEATLAVTGLPLDEPWSSFDAAGPSLVPGREVVRAVPAGPGARRLVGCGRPLQGVEVGVVDAAGGPVPAGVVGEIALAGPSVAAAGEGGTLRTGDAGFVHGGQLYVLGRLGDSLKVRGRTVFAEDLEGELAALGVDSRRLAVALGAHEGVATVLAVLEGARAGRVERARALLRRRGDGARVVVVAGPPGSVPRTTSGKPRRRALWEAYTGGRLPGRAAARTAEVRRA